MRLFSSPPAYNFTLPTTTVPEPMVQLMLDELQAAALQL